VVVFFTGQNLRYAGEGCIPHPSGSLSAVLEPWTRRVSQWNEQYSQNLDMTLSLDASQRTWSLSHSRLKFTKTATAAYLFSYRPV